MALPIHADMKVEAALTAAPQTLSVFVEYGFKPLQNPLLRRTFAPLVTIRGAAKMHHWDAAKLERFLAELNAKASLPPDDGVPPDEVPVTLYDLGDVAGMAAVGIRVGPELVEIDNMGLEPPEPMVRILSVAQQLSPGQRLVATNFRRPMLLYPKLEELGLTHETEPLDDGHFRITVRKER